MITLTQVPAETWGKDGIRVDRIAPGLIRTDLVSPSSSSVTGQTLALDKGQLL
jgi:NAD(P)-dependent dehydrogenase (short-subunit alcohol dehydrogenase family)